MNIHPTAVVSPDANIGQGVTIGPYAVVDSGVAVGEGTEIGPHTYLTGNTTIGPFCVLHHRVTIGDMPQVVPRVRAPGRVVIGREVTIREGVTIHASKSLDSTTSIGDNCIFMVASHVGHDAQVGMRVMLANGAALGGHSIVEDDVGISAMVPVHQWCRIGKHAYVGGGFRVVKDIPPFILAAGEPLRAVGLNMVGLRRNGFDSERILRLKKLYGLFFRSDLNTSQAMSVLSQWPPDPDHKSFARFVKDAARGIIK